MRPYIVQAITDGNGRIIKRTQPKIIRRVLSSKTAGTIRNIMRSVVEDGGTGTHAAIENYTVGGKTGTAQKTDKSGTYAKGKYTASFVGFTPSENPELTILVVVDEPQKTYYGCLLYTSPSPRDRS